MKRILLSSACIVAFAGAAAADGHAGISFSGSANLGFNDDALGDNDGFYSDLDIKAGFAAVLDNGLTAAASLDLEDLANSKNGLTYELSLTSETAGMYYGDTNFAAQNVWVAAGDMEADGFSEADGEEALRAELTFGAVSAQMSYVLANNEGTRNVADSVNQLSLGVAADFGGVNVVAAYQAESDEAAGFYGDRDKPAAGTNPTYGTNGDFKDAEVFGLSVGTSFSGADVRLAYASNETAGTDSTGIQVSYPIGPVTATAYYVSESAGGDNFGVTLAYENGPIAVKLDYDDDQGVEKIGLEGSYDVGNGLTIFAGYLTDDGTDERTYIAGSYDLGSGASLLVSYANDADDVDGDEIGAGDYQRGTTVELTFEF